MVSLMQRRREMMQAAGVSPLPEWDYEWDASKGLLDANGNGFVYNRAGSTGYACTIVDDYLRFRGSSSNYKYYTYQNVYNTGVMEAEIYTASNASMRIAFSNGEYGIGIRLQTSTNYNGIYLGNTLTTKLVSASSATKYTVRLVLKSGLVGDIYINNVLKAEDVDVTDWALPDIRITGMGSGSANVYSRLYSLKMKFNRI